MSDAIKICRALLSVYDKTGIVEFARALHDEFGVELISTGGTAKVLKDAGLPVTLVEEITGFPEMMDGRVKTLHPKIHAAILADRDNPEHMRQLQEQGIEPIDMVVVNLYPFEQTIAKPGCTFEEAIEMIDIGGPCLLRAAAKNHKHVLVLSNPAAYRRTLCFLRHDEKDPGPTWPFWLMTKAFQETAPYDIAIHNYVGELYWKTPFLPALLLDFTMDTPTPGNELRYGENPHQRASTYSQPGAETRLSSSDANMSFNNYADASAALELCAELARATAARGSAKFHFARPAMCNFAGPSEARFPPVRDEVTYRRKLPHWQISGATYFVTFSSAIGELSEPERDAVLEAVRYWDGRKLDLHATVVMRDHVHILLTSRQVAPDRPDRYNLTELVQSIKANSARRINRLRGRGGQVWVRESYDRWLRSPEEFLEKWNYIANNPVKEGLAATPDAYRWWHATETVGAFEEKTTGLSCEENLRTTIVARGTAVCFIKHTNACGVAVDTDPIEAYRRAYLGDPNAAMGGILAVNFDVTPAFAETVMETYPRWGKAAGAGGFFVEVWLAPSFDDKAVKIIRGEAEGKPKKDWGQRVRLLAVGDMSAPPDPNELDFKRISGGMLVQTRDLVGLNEDQWQVVTQRQPTQAEMDDLRLAWLICKHTKSNAVTICKDGMLIGNGAGQMSRVMSARIATWLAKENGHADQLKGAVAASDAFFPFRDGPDILAEGGVTALIQPGGSKRDPDVIAACNERGVAMIFTGTRHFRH